MDCHHNLKQIRRSRIRDREVDASMVRMSTSGLVVLLMAVLLAAGCLGGILDRVDQDEGKMVVAASTHEVLRAQGISAKSILQDVTLEKMVFTISQGSSTDTKEVSVSGTEDTVEASFGNLASGIWSVQVQAIDDEDRVIADGSGDGTVTPETVTSVPVTLQVKPGDLMIRVEVPGDASIASGEATLLGLDSENDNIERSFDAVPGETASILVQSLEARVWLVEIELQDDRGDTIQSEMTHVPVLPGRQNTLQVACTPGGLLFNVSWDLPPETPQNVTASYGNGVVLVSWDAVAGAEGYVVIRSLDEDGPGIPLQRRLITYTSIEDSRVESGERYYYRVVAYGQQGLSSRYSQAVAVTAEEIPIRFDDENLEQAIREEIGKTEGVLYASDVSDIHELVAGDRGIQSLEGIQNLTSLEVLRLWYNELSDLSPVASLMSLEQLSLEDNQVSDLSPLENLTNLRFLGISKNQVSDLSPLANLTNLRWLYFGWNKVSDISVLENLTRLRSLDFHYNEVTNLSVLKNLTSLEWLHFWGNQVNDISPVVNLTNLYSMGFRGNNVSDLSPLVANEGLGAGDWVYMQNNLLDLTPGSQNMQDIQALIDRGVNVAYEPQRDLSDQTMGEIP